MRQIRPVVYSGKVGAKPTKPRYTVGSKRIIKTPYKLSGGPMHGHTLYLESDDTLIFTMAGQTGQYLGGCWKCTSPQP